MLGRLIASVSLLAACERVAPPSLDAPPLAPPALEPVPSSELRSETRAPEQPPPPAISAVRPPRHTTTSRRWFLGLAAPERQIVLELCRERVVDPCAGLLGKPDGEPNRAAELMAWLGDDRDQASTFCDERTGTICDTPLVIAFDAQPIELAPASGARFAFVPGVPASTDWPTAATPWIALDRDGDGAITSGAELFGSATVLPGGATAHHGFEALAALDANADGVIDRADPAFAALLLWADADGDRASAPGELRPLADVVTSIPLAYERDARCTARGACEGERGVVHWRDGGTARVGAVVDLYLPRR